jgi:SpoVK/Ycf46/Vps4 family AAA+-type ATPase
MQGKPAVGIDFARLARETKEFSGADIRGAVDQAVEAKLMEAMRSTRKLSEPPPLTTSDLVAAIRKQKPTTREWFETARNYAIYANEGGFYDDVLDYLKIARGPRL